MRILFYFGGFASVGGIETFSYNLLSSLQRNDHLCTLLCWGARSDLLTTIQQSGVKIVRSFWRWGCRWHLPDWILLLFGLKYARQADIVVVGKLFPTKALMHIRRSMGAKTPLVFITPYKPDPRMSEGERLAIFAALTQFDLVLVQAESFIKGLQQIGYEGRTGIVPYIPPMPGSLEPFPNDENLNIGFLGRLVEDKNLPLLLKTLKYLRTYYTDDMVRTGFKKAVLHIFGDGHLRMKLEKLAADLGISRFVVFHGVVSNSRIARAIASCHVFAFTSRREGQCLAALEILNQGRPIVATPAGALPDILADNRLGKLVEDASPKNLATALMSVGTAIVEKSIQPHKIQSAYLERYAPEDIINRYENEFSAILTDTFSG